MTRYCHGCGQQIDPERIEAIPTTTTCTGCSKTPKVIGFMVPTASKGCAPVLNIVDTTNEEHVRQAHNANKRKR